MVSHFTQRYRISYGRNNISLCPFRFLLSHRKLFPAAKEAFTIDLPPNLNSESLLKYWELNLPLIKLNNHKESENNIQLFLERGNGYYNKSNGETSYEIITRRPVISFKPVTS